MAERQREIVLVGGGTRMLRLAVGWLCVGLGLLGAVLPVLPTTPFLIVAAWAFSTCSPRFHDWLVEHPRFGPPVRAWRRHGVISTRTKMLAVTMMAASLGYVTLFVAENWLVPAAAALPMALTAVWLLTRPSQVREEA